MAEQSLLGCILIDPECFNTIAGMVKSTDFYIREHEQIFLAMQKLYSENNEIDAVTLVDTLVRLGVYEKSGGEDYVRHLGDVVPGAMNVKDYA